MAQKAHKFSKVALQICCFPNGTESRGEVTLAGAQGMTFSAAYGHERSGQWADVWPAIKYGDNVLITASKADILYQSMLQGGEQTADYHRSLLKSAQACCMVSPYCCSLPQTCFQSVGLQCTSSAPIRQGGRTWFTRLYSIISFLESFMRQAPPKDDDCVIVGVKSATAARLERRKCLEDAVGPLVG